MADSTSTLTDPFDADKRSAIMRAVKSRDTTPEMIVRRTAHALGYRHRLGGCGLPGKPDLVFAGRRKAIFVHGCFWHGHACKRGARPPTANAAYWSAKIARNRTRDAASLQALASLGWSVLTLWECELSDRGALAARIRSFLG
jgi:DNA mismatch endonuclease (patch repair protein)